MKTCGTDVEHGLDFIRNEEFNARLVRDYLTQVEAIRKGGGAESASRQKKRGKLLARERIDNLIDPGTRLLEIGTMGALGMYHSYGDAPSAGIVTGIGKINGRHVVVVANDSTVKAGAYFPLTIKKNLRAQEIAMENLLPIVYLVDSSGVFLPMQSEIFPDRDDFGRIFYNNAVMSSMGIPQISAIMGPCVAGGAYLPI
ncbi:MAG: acyl-CoA carboxylase subunit beta, partial [Bacteroidetes bacterium]|nr:acyl-CoA carboxylase subunit beta [Bacteroidota bacterium]